MRNLARWFQKRVRRSWVLALLGVATAWLVLYLLPPRNRGTSLELIALGADGRFAEEISIPSHWTSTTGLGPGAVVRVPLILAVRNTGKKPAPAARLELSLPTRYRISGADGNPLPSEIVPGTPMARYTIEVPATRAAAGLVAGYLPVLDTIWLEPIIPSFYCIVLSDSVPDFVPSPPAPIEAISRVRIFYSFTGQDIRHRQTGLLAVQLDPALLKQETPTPPPVFPTEYGDPAVPRPYLSTLEYVGSRRARCGDPQDPVEILSTLWETPAGGRFFVLDYGGTPRKYLFDLNRDSIIELEIWDATGSGRFDARRQARLPIPTFLMPPPPSSPYDASFLAALSQEQLLALDRYGQALMEPYQFQTRSPEKGPRTDRYRPGTITGDDDILERRPGIVNRYWSDPAYESVPAIPPAGQRAPAAGRRLEPHTSQPPTLGRPITPSARPPAERPPVSPPSGDGAPAQTAPPARPAKPVPAPAETAPKPKVLGKPLDSIPARPRPDTTGHRP